ncbi:HAD family hydrolase [Halarcobacter bivalviorum]|uniref:phosphoglycolate phosphatase n=1 Tax=Halarcobacter bivalviorum TaxID=663364 RepID=A0AB33GMW6_9BACT|nr:HAD family hydrolase [Halarcobacter bivalviorum]AXH13556.1 phosphoglycolate phosphatase [Halarcobacter bivalviorum]
MKNNGFIFDLDGTLIDSLTDIALCSNIVLKEFNLPIHEITEYKYFVGGGAEVLVNNAIPKDSSNEMAIEVLKRFKQVYDSEFHYNTKPYEGIYDLLDLLHENEIKVAILSNKPHEFTIKYVNEFFPKYTNILEVHGSKDDVPKKPHPHAALEIAKALELTCENIYFVGDSDVDMKTAKNSNMKAVGVSWGFRGTKELIENGADHIVKTPLDIFELIKKS